ncbi:hypothetical protein SeMB42_g06893 [Synchytrium endobioticum]|uniref:Mitochondrial import inner membrane translocase subunit TIM50 n=1 Tax=Synchytrium endobioticum TaxID=286115 RepID=A0A507C9L1_9FUNG|nr:hypothetical protein SeMB42_g06893 [Synchytrium endobioticum]
MAGRVIFMRGLRTASKPSFGSSTCHSSSFSSTSSPSIQSYLLNNSTTAGIPNNLFSPSIQSRAPVSNVYRSAAQAYRHAVHSKSSHCHSLKSSALSSPPGSFMRGISSSVSSSASSSSSTSTRGVAGTSSAKAISSRGLCTTGTKSKSVPSASNGGNSSAGESVSGTSDTDKGGGIDPGGGSHGVHPGGATTTASSGTNADSASKQQAAPDNDAEHLQAAEAYGLGLLDAAAKASPSKNPPAAPSTTASTPPPSSNDSAKDYHDRPDPAGDPLEHGDEQRKSRQASFFLLACSFMAGAATFVILGMPTQDDRRLPNESLVGGYYRRAKTAVRSWYKSFSDPISDKLLPDPLPEPYQRPYTLVIALNDCLVHSVWDKENGWRAGKRPYVDWFLSYMSQFYEIVVFTTGMPHVAHPVIEKLDPYRFIMYRLYRDSTRFTDNKFLKDLSVLNRDLAKTIIIDVNPDSYSLQPENAVPIKKWAGEAEDAELLRLIPFLEALAMSGAPDVRPILRSYQGRDIPSAWAEYQGRLREEFEEKRKASVAAKKPSGIQGILTSLFGAGTRIAPVQDENPIDILHHQAHEMRQQFWKEQESIKQQMEEQRKFDEAEMEKQLAAMKAKKLSLWEFMSTAQPHPGQAQQQQSN